MATDWMSPATLVANGALFSKLLIAVLGWYSWEVIVTLWYDIEIVTRRRPWKWPVVLYWTTKYTMFWAGIGLVISSNVTTEINCQPLYVFNQLMGNAAIGGASSLLMMRVFAIWAQNLYIVVPLAVLSVGQWAILLHSVTTVQAHYVAAAGGCAVTAAPQVFLQLLYIYTMSFDFLVLVLSTIGLLRLPGRSGTKVSGLWQLLNRDGLFFFIAAFTSNLIVVILMTMNLNPIMNIIAAVPAAALTSTVSCRSFVRLSTFNQPSTAHISSNGNRGGASRLGTTHVLGKKSGLAPAYGTGAANGVHVQMDTFVSTGNRNPNQSTLSFHDSGDVESQSEKQRDPVLGYGGDSDYERSYPPK